MLARGGGGGGGRGRGTRGPGVMMELGRGWACGGVC